MGYEWNAGDISNIVTISAAALASVFKSRCSEISVFCGLFKCNRVVPPEEDEDPPAP